MLRVIWGIKMTARSMPLSRTSLPCELALVGKPRFLASSRSALSSQTTGENAQKEMFGAFVDNIDLAKEKVDRQVAEAVRQALLDHRVIGFPMQRFHETEKGASETLVHMAKTIFNADLESTSGGKFVQLYMSTGGRKNAFNSDWFHSDHSYQNIPASVTMLWAIDVGPGPGNATKFIDMVAAAKDLPPLLRGKIEGRTAKHELDGWVIRGGGPSKGLTATHPILRPHPVTGEECLYISPAYTTSIEGETDGSLLEELFRFVDQRFQMTFAYKPGDLVMWDNASVIHKATTMELPENAKRTMMRICVLGVEDAYWGSLPPLPCGFSVEEALGMQNPLGIQKK